MTVEAQLHARWRALVPTAVALGGDLISRYADPSRHYHTLEHLRAVLDGVDRLQAEAADVYLVELAAWFHDAVYDAHRDDNEEQSALLAESKLTSTGLDRAAVAEVARLVRMTARHDPTPGDANAAVLSDADLAVLASEPEAYDAYADAVRREYGHVSDAGWRAGRATVLTQLIGLGRLFHTSLGRSEWERPARTNLSRELSRLRAVSEEPAPPR
ncbi:MAG: metal-dependent phosphohydrolase [Nocardioidaceae bacterium]